VRAVEAESDGVVGQGLGLLDPAELRLGIDEAPDEPGAGEPVGPERLARDPGAAAQRRSNSERELLTEAEKTFDLLYEAYYPAPKS